MLSRDSARESVTLYNYMEILAEDGTPHAFYKRTVRHDCIWKQDSEATYEATGQVNRDAVTIWIPYHATYFSVQRGQLFTGKGWTVQIGPELLGTYIVRGICLFEFAATPVKEFTREQVIPFEAQFQCKRPQEIIEEFIGSRNMWYLEVRCP